MPHATYWLKPFTYLCPIIAFASVAPQTTHSATAGDDTPHLMKVLTFFNDIVQKESFNSIRGKILKYYDSKTMDQKYVDAAQLFHGKWTKEAQSFLLNTYLFISEKRRVFIPEFAETFASVLNHLCQTSLFHHHNKDHNILSGLILSSMVNGIDPTLHIQFQNFIITQVVNLYLVAIDITTEHGKRNVLTCMIFHQVSQETRRQDIHDILKAWVIKHISTQLKTDLTPWHPRIDNHIYTMLTSYYVHIAPYLPSHPRPPADYITPTDQILQTHDETVTHAQTPPLNDTTNSTDKETSLMPLKKRRVTLDEAF